jgi:hypothetical protein
VRAVEVESFDPERLPAKIALLPKFLRSFYLRFLAEICDLSIERFTIEERDEVSDHVVDLESGEKDRGSWALLHDFVDLCDYFDDFGLLSVPEAAQEHEVEIVELTARVLHDLSSWASGSSKTRLSDQAEALACKLELLNTAKAT